MQTDHVVFHVVCNPLDLSRCGDAFCASTTDGLIRGAYCLMEPANFRSRGIFQYKQHQDGTNLLSVN